VDADESVFFVFFIEGFEGYVDIFPRVELTEGGVGFVLAHMGKFGIPC